MKKIKIFAFILALIMMLSLAACKNTGDPENSSDPASGETGDPSSSEGAGDTTAAEDVDVLALILKAQEIADGYESAVQTVTMTIKMGDSVTSEEVTVTKKNGNNATCTTTVSGTVTESILLDGSEILYYSDTSGAFILTDATLDDFDKLQNPSSDEIDPFDFEDADNFGPGTSVKTETGYDFTIGFSEQGKERMINSLGVPEGYTVKADKMTISGEIDAEGNMPRMKYEMVITMSASGISVTMSCDAVMEFTQIGEDVKLDAAPVGVVYVQFGKVADYHKYLAAVDNHAKYSTAGFPVEFEREFKIHQPSGFAQKPFEMDIYTHSAYDPAKGASFLVDNRVTGRAAQYYSNIKQVVFKESEEKIHVDPSIKHDQVLTSIISELYATELGTLYCDKVDSISNGTYRFRIEDKNAKAILTAYISNNLGVDITDVNIGRAQYIVCIGEDGKYTSVAIEIDAGFIANGESYVVSLMDDVRIKSYNEVNIVTLTPIA